MASSGFGSTREREEEERWRWLRAMRDGLDRLFKAMIFGLIAGLFVALIALVAALASASGGFDAVLGALMVAMLLGLLVNIIYALLVANALEALSEPLREDMGSRGRALAVVIVATSLINFAALLTVSSPTALASAIILSKSLNILAYLVAAWALWPLGRLNPGGDMLRVGLLLEIVGALVPIVGFIGAIMVLYSVYKMREAAEAGFLQESPF